MTAASTELNRVSARILNHHNQCFLVFSKLYHCCNVSERHLGAQSECNPSLHRTPYFLSICRMGATITHNMTFHAWISRTSFQTKEDWTVTNTKWCDQSLKLYKLSLVPVREKAPMKNLPGSQIDVQSGNGEKENSAKNLVWEGSHLERVRTKHGAGVRRPLFGPGPRTTIMDRVHGHFVNFYRKVLHRVHEHSFLNSESWTNTEKNNNNNNKIWRDAVDRCSRLITNI